MGRPIVPIRERFEAKVDRSLGQGPDGECHEWQGYKTSQGYGQIKEDYPSRKLIRAHRLAMELSGTIIPDRMFVCHRCDNPPCCNADHLFIGSVKDNNQDCIRKGREKKVKGSKHGMSKLTEEMVRDIKHELRDGHMGIGKRLAEEYCVSQATITRIKNGNKWTHVK